MFRLVRIPVMLLLISLAVIGQTKSDRERANLLGPVKSVSESYTRYKNSKPKKRDTVTYNSKGNEIERFMVSDYGFEMGKQAQTFDSLGQLTESTYTNEKGIVVERYKYSYVRGRLVESLHYDGKSVLREKTVRIFDSEGNLTKETYFDPNIARAETVYTNDTSGKAIEVAFYLTGGKKAYAPIGPCLGAHRVTFGYDDKGRVISKSAFETDGKLKKSWTYAYDERGNISLYVIKSNPIITTVSYNYEYDEKGNWIKRTSVRNEDGQLFDFMLGVAGKPVTPEEKKKIEEEKAKYAPSPEITTREITYY
ncbi:MAG: hypothetical protein IPL32_11980 [Chloracidobacterium sp.]|nr:hypothetical protein [Chloracidobacterium sp.]